MKHEKEVLENVTKARTSLMNAQTPQDNVKADNMLTGALKTLFAVAENYPDLKANQNFLNLQDELAHTENKIAYSRQHFNDSVLAYNNSIETFPGVTIAKMMGRKERMMLEVPEADKELYEKKCPRVLYFIIGHVCNFYLTHLCNSFYISPTMANRTHPGDPNWLDLYRWHLYVLSPECTKSRESTASKS
jgi:hypothetical protein